MKKPLKIERLSAVWTNNLLILL